MGGKASRLVWSNDCCSVLIAEVNSERTNLSPFTKGYRGLASLTMRLYQTYSICGGTVIPISLCLTGEVWIDHFINPISNIQITMPY